MKKAFFALLALGFLSCAKSQPSIPVTFYLADSGPFTKGIAEEISNSLPDEMTLSLIGSQTYQIQTGQTFSIPPGHYQVKGEITPEATQYIYGTLRYLSPTPKIVVETEIDIVPGEDVYSVPVQYGSFALGILPSETEEWTGKFKGTFGEVNCMKTDDVWWIFVTGNLYGDSTFDTTLKPYNGKSITYRIYTQDVQGSGMLAEFGKWYILHPGGVANQSGALGLDFPEWTAGN